MSRNAGVVKLLALLILSSACAPDAASETSTPAPTSTAGPVTTSADVTTSTVAEPEFDAAEVPAIALFLATVDRSLSGTDLEGVAFDEPESLINTGVLFCALLDEGVDPLDVMRGWVAALSADGATPTDDDLLLGGVVLGAAAQFLCPEHLEKLEL